MTDLRKAAEQAIALICSARLCEVNSMSSRQEMLRLMIEATDTLRAALAEPVQEPVAWMEGPHGAIRANPLYKISAPQSVAWSIPLYTAPPQRKPLTDEEIGAAANSVRWSQQYHVDFTRAIERAHGITK